MRPTLIIADSSQQKDSKHNISANQIIGTKISRIIK
jgi:hypothetical protein